MTEQNLTEAARKSRGFRTLLTVVYVVFAISATARSLVQIMRGFEQAPLAYSLSLFAALTYIALAVLMSRPQPPKALTLTVVGVELLGVVSIGLLSVLMPQLFPDATVWSYFGAGYGYFPVILPVIAVFTLLREGRK